MKVTRKVVRIDEEKCDGCGLCIPSCAEGAIQLVDGKARLISEKFCDGLGACLGECPKGAISIEEREAEEFDEEAVMEYQKALEKTASSIPGCPVSQKAQEFKESKTTKLWHWPVKINLVPVDADFLKESFLLVIADCVGVCYPTLQDDFFNKKVVLIGCPKFDDQRRYVEKFSQIFQKNAIKGIQLLRMEVPCCGGLAVILKNAMKTAGVQIPMEEVVIGIKGEILSRAVI
jgi:ferredoxin